MYARFLKSMLSDRVKRRETVTKLPYLTAFTDVWHLPNPKKQKQKNINSNVSDGDICTPERNRTV